MLIRKLEKKTFLIRSGLFKMCGILPDVSPEIRILLSLLLNNCENLTRGKYPYCIHKLA